MSKVINILYNAIKTPDGTTLVSEHIHDYKTHVDKVTGEVYMVDGGNAYLRRNNTKIHAEDLSVTTESSFQDQRSVPFWKTYGKSGKEAPRKISLKSMEDNHLYAIIETQHHIKGTYVEELINREISYRKSLRNDPASLVAANP